MGSASAMDDAGSKHSFMHRFEVLRAVKIKSRSSGCGAI